MLWASTLSGFQYTDLWWVFIVPEHMKEVAVVMVKDGYHALGFTILEWLALYLKTTSWAWPLFLLQHASYAF